MTLSVMVGAEQTHIKSVLELTGVKGQLERESKIWSPVNNNLKDQT